MRVGVKDGRERKRKRRAEAKIRIRWLTGRYRIGSSRLGSDGCSPSEEYAVRSCVVFK